LIERAKLARRISRQAAVLLAKDVQLTSICGEDYDDLLGEAGIQFSKRPEFALPIGKKLKALGEVTDPDKSLTLLDSVYNSISQLVKASGLLRLRESLKSDMPEAGVYLFFDENERRLKDPRELRIVRIGTHGVAAG
jgi:hypothetical protein